MSRSALAVLLGGALRRIKPVFETHHDSIPSNHPAAVAAFDDAFGRLAKDLIAWTAQVL